MTEREETPGAKLAGTQLGRYVLGAQIGAGGAASVHLALLRGPNGFERVFAVKVVHDHLALSARFVNLFLDEANLAVRLEHPNIVRTYELAREGETLFLAMEYLHGQPLARLIERCRERRERLAPELVAWIGARAADALEYAHSLTDAAGNSLGVVHRDVCPENVFLTYDGRVVLIDFGSAKAEGRANKTGARIRGKLGYMAPEQLRQLPLDHRADLFALGATLYEAAVGASPLAAAPGEEFREPSLEDAVPPPSSLLPGFPEELSGILLRALERDPEMRPSAAGELAHDLDHFAGQNASPSSLSELLGSYFELERVAQDVAVAELRATRTFIRSLPPGLTTTAAPTAASVRPAVHEPPSRWGILVLGFALSMAVASVIVVRCAAKGSGGAGPAAQPAPVDPRSGPGNPTPSTKAPRLVSDAGGARFVP